MHIILDVVIAIAAAVAGYEAHYRFALKTFKLAEQKLISEGKSESASLLADVRVRIFSI